MVPRGRRDALTINLAPPSGRYLSFVEPEEIAETIIGLYKTEVGTRGTSGSRREVRELTIQLWVPHGNPRVRREIMLETIGNTPLIRLRRIPPPNSAEIWLKIEGLNPTGSYKDRMALAMVEGLEDDGKVDSATSILECTGGSTGSSLAFVCAVKGYKFTVISSDAYAREKLDSMRALGAIVLVEPSRGGKVTPDLWPRMIDRAKSLVDRGGYVYLDQFHNPHAPVGYEKMGEEILYQTRKPIDAVCGAVGTAGMIMGVGSVIRARWPSVQVVALEPDSSPVLSGGLPGPHGIDGTATGFVPPLFSREVVTDVLALPEQEARAMARRLAREEGIFAGTSTGLNVVAALQLAEEVGKGGMVVTAACDSGFKYLDGALYRDDAHRTNTSHT